MCSTVTLVRAFLVCQHKVAQKIEDGNFKFLYKSPHLLYTESGKKLQEGVRPMKKLVCGDCGKRYDFHRDDFCPRCGAFNTPPKQLTVDNYGNVIRVDGINESNHTGSFVHREVHREKAVRKIKDPDRGVGKSTPIQIKTIQKKKKINSVVEKLLAQLVFFAFVGYLFGLMFGFW